MPLFGAVAEKLLPRDMHFALLPAYSARRTARNLAAANLSPELLARTRIYSWCEFDGLMYLLQNECDGIYRCIDQAAGEGGQGAAELVCNHWRTSENELSLGYLAAGAFGAVSPQDFYKSFLGALAGQKSEPRLAKAAVRAGRGDGVRRRESLQSRLLRAGVLEPAEHLVDTAEHREVQDDARQDCPADRRRGAARLAPEGQDRCTLWVNRLEASQVHCDVVLHLRAMHELVDWHAGKLVSPNPPVHAGLLPAVDRERFLRHAKAARELAAQYVSLCASALPDRMSEGTLTSYEYVMYGLLDKSLAEFAGVEAPASQGQAAAGPPSPIG